MQPTLTLMQAITQEVIDGEVTIFRFMTIVLCFASAVCAMIVLARAVKRYLQGDRRVCMPVVSVMGTMVVFIMAMLGSMIQLLWWIQNQVPLAWYRAPLMFVVVTVAFITMLQTVNFIYPKRKNVHRDNQDVHNL